MVLKLLIVSALFYAVSGHYRCSERSALHLQKRSAFEFSIGILDRVAQNNDAHFVFSPLSTWLQLSALAEGAQKDTLRELWNITKHHRNKCFKLKLRRLLRKQSRELSQEYRRKSVVVIDKFMAVKDNYIRNVLMFYGVKILLKNFDYPLVTANEVNNFIARGTQGVFNDSVYPDDFNNTVMVLSDNVFFRSAWKFPFNPVYTQTKPFNSYQDPPVQTGYVNMMSVTGYFNMTEMTMINARVVEIPCNDEFSMLILLPIQINTWVGDTFYNLKKTTLNSVFNRFKTEGSKLVNVQLPRFKINSTVDNLIELLFDMGIRSVFNPNLADLSLISDYTLYASLMTQVADIEVTEEGVRANVSAAPIINKADDVLEFVADRPFAYIIVHRKSQFILFAGTYSNPEVY